MSFLRRAFGKEKRPTYESKTYVGTPGKFGERRSPSDILVVSHPSPTDYQVHLDYVGRKTRREQALSDLSAHPASEDYSEESSEEDESEEDYSRAEDTMYSDEEDCEHLVLVYQERCPSKPVQVQTLPQHQQCPYIPAVNRQTAQKQWERLRSHIVHRQATALQRTQQHPMRYTAPQRVSFLPSRQVAQQQRHYSEPVSYQLAAGFATQSQRRHGDPIYYQLSVQAEIRVAARSAARPAARSAVYRLYQQKTLHQKYGLAHVPQARPYKMVGGIPVYYDEIIPGAWVDWAIEHVNSRATSARSWAGGEVVKVACSMGTGFGENSTHRSML